MGKPISSIGGLGTSVIGGPVMAFTFFNVFTLPVFGGLKTSSGGLGQSGGSALFYGNSRGNLLMDNLIDVGVVLINRYSRGTVVIIDGGDRLDVVASKVRIKSGICSCSPTLIDVRRGWPSSKTTSRETKTRLDVTSWTL